MRKFVQAVSVLFLASSTVMPVFALDEYKLGSASYSQGNFPQAKTHLVKATVANPKSWQAHYQLANTFVALKDSAAAKKTYEKCIVCKPPEDIKQRCRDAISYINTNPSLKAPEPPPRPITVQNVVPSSSAAAAASSPSGDSGQGNSDLEARKARIMASANQRVEHLRKEEKERMEELDAGSNQRYQYSDGTVKTAADPEVERQVKLEYEQKINTIMEDARRQAANLR